MQVPFLDLKTQFKQIQDEVMPMLVEAMTNAMFIGGPQVGGFESEFAEFCGTEYCVGVNSGTDALRFALIALGIGAGDEVITVPNTFIATTEAISQTGARPVFVDIDPKTCNMDPNKLDDYLNNRFTSNAPRVASWPKAVIPVHLYGQPAEMDPILEIGEKRGIKVIEDACQAHGATYKNRIAGSMGDAGCFSFYPGKNLGAFGEGGAVVTNDRAVADKIKMIRDHGQSRKYFHDMEGYNGRLDAIQAGVLRIKLKRLSQWNSARRKNAALYSDQLGDIPGVVSVQEADGVSSVYHLYVILVEDRDGLQQFLGSKEIGTGLHYPFPLHRQNAYTHLGYKEGDFPIAEGISKRLLSLPMYAELTREQIEYVTGCIKEFYSEKK